MDCSMLSHVRNRTRPMAPSRDRGGGAKGMVGMGSHRHRDDHSHRGAGSRIKGHGLCVPKLAL